MGRSSSSSSCLKIIACGSGDAADNDDVAASEAKASGDKRGWSFRKRSGRHRVLGNTVSLENVTATDKEIPQVINSEFQAPVKSSSPDEKSQLPRPVEKINEAVSVAEHISELKTPVVISSENDVCATDAQSKIAQAVDSLQIAGNVESDESRVHNPVAASQLDSDMGMDKSKIGNYGVAPEVNGNTECAESKISESVVASEDVAESVVASEDVAEAVVASEDVAEPVVASEDVAEASAILDEPVAIIIQTAIRGFLAQRGLIQLKSAVKLQAAIRGHLVRRNAVETLHCIRAIVKVQALVRARSSKALDHKNKPMDAQFSTVKLLRNSFARQLLESIPKSKSVNIRCDPLRPNSAWGWLERWMSFSSSEVDQTLHPTAGPEDDNHDQQTSIECSSVVFSDPVDSKFNMTEVANSPENEENLIHDVSPVDSQSGCALSTEVTTEQPLSEGTEIIKGDLASLEMDALADGSFQKQAEPSSHVDNPALRTEPPKLSTKRPASEELDGEGKKFTYGSRKASNPAFIAAQSKFEELSSSAKSGRSVSSSHQDVGGEYQADTASSVEETAKKPDVPSMKVTGSFDPRGPVAGSECGTELSISSTLDSPDRSDSGNAEAEQHKISEEMSPDHSCREGPDVETNGMSSHYVTDVPSLQIEQEQAHRTNGVSAEPVAAEVSSQEEQKLEMNESDLQRNLESEIPVMASDSLPIEQKHELNGFDSQMENGSGMEHQTYKSSPEASPKSHRTVPESQGTPSSQVSVKSKRNKIDKSGSNTKRSSLSAGKKSPSNPGVDSGARSSTEHLPKDHKSGKRRNSFGSAKSDNADQEPRDSSSRSSLPSYMQATESARAKANSPRSSPDVHDKEVYNKKRHSLPGASGRQGSPRIQRSSSQAAQGAKANGSNERKWQR